MPKRRGEKEREATAYHEAGHAVVGLELGIRIKSVNIVQDEEAGRLGLCEGGKFPKWFEPDVVKDTKARLHAEEHIMFSLAGVEAELRLTGRFNHVGAHGDYVGADQLAVYFCENEQERFAFMNWLSLRTRNMLYREHVWLKVEAVAKALLDRERLSANELRAICQNAMQEAIKRPRR